MHVRHRRWSWGRCTGIRCHLRDVNKRRLTKLARSNLSLMRPSSLRLAWHLWNRCEDKLTLLRWAGLRLTLRSASTLHCCHVTSNCRNNKQTRYNELWWQLQTVTSFFQILTIHWHRWTILVCLWHWHSSSTTCWWWHLEEIKKS